MKKKRITNGELLRRYRDPTQPGSLGGAERFARAQGVSVKRVKAVLKRDLGYSLHKPVRRRFPTSGVMVHGPNEQWAADLIEVQNIAKWNRGVKYLLCVIDVFSKFAWVLPLKSKTGLSVMTAFSRLVAGRRKPKTLQTDDGKEFYNSHFQNMLRKKGIHHFSTSGDTKASVVERFNRTFKDRLYRYFTVYNTLSFLDVLTQLVRGYNASYHRSIGMAPKHVALENTPKVWNTLYGSDVAKKPAKTRFRKGDHVRLNKKFRTFKKSYLPGWTEEVFLVSEARRGPVNTYKIVEWDGTPIKGTFYNEDLQKVDAKDDDVFRIEKIVKRQGNRVLVGWKGWPTKYDSWVSKKDVIRLHHVPHSGHK